MTRPVVFAAVGGLILAVAGFFAGRASVGSSQIENGSSLAMEKERSFSDIRARRSEGTGDWRSKGDARAVVQRLVARHRESKESGANFDFRTEAQQIFDKMTLDEVHVALDEIEGIENFATRRDLRNLLVERWGALDGEAALSYAFELRNVNRVGAFGAALSGLVKINPEQAYRWHEKNRQSLFGGAIASKSYDTIFYNVMARNDLKMTISEVAKLDEGRKNAAVEVLASDFALDNENRSEFFQLLENEVGAEAALSAKKRLAKSLGWYDPDQAARYIESLDVSSEEKRQMESELFRSWQGTDVAKALQWRLSRVSSGKERQQAIEASFGGWLTVDETSASEWLREQPEEVMTDTLFQDAAKKLYQYPIENYGRAVKWANQIVEDEVRLKELGLLYRRWSRREQESAEEWLAALDEEERVGVLKEVDKLDPKKQKEAERLRIFQSTVQQRIEELENSEGGEKEIEAHRQALELLLEESESQ